MDSTGRRDKYLAIDFGLKRIGIAITDDLKLMAFQRGYIENKKGVLEEIIGLVNKENVSRIIIGYPVNFKSEETDASSHVIEFIEKLKIIAEKNQLNTEIILFDERFTSSIARHYISMSDLPKKKKHNKGFLDSASAQIILEDYLTKEKNLNR